MAAWRPPDDQPDLNLCNADLSGANLSRANLTGANLTEADLSGADFTRANLNGANLTDADLLFAVLSDSTLTKATLTSADLTGAKLYRATLDLDANLTDANLSVANLTDANLTWANFTGANLYRAILTDADLSGAILFNATLTDANLENTQLAGADLTRAVYAPASPAPDAAYVWEIKGIDTVCFPQGREIGLVQLRELLQKAGLRGLERQATYTLESGKTAFGLAGWWPYPSVHFNLATEDTRPCTKLLANAEAASVGRAAEAVLRRVFFDWTTAYGLRPFRALGILFGVWLLLIPVYWWTIRKRLPNASRRAGIYRIWAKDRIVVQAGGPALASSARVERLYSGRLAALGWAMWFSLQSAFHVGFREFSVGTWLSRIHPRQFVLEATGWVRTVSGLQSLVSLILLALFVLTYFGRPFQ